MRRKSHGVVIAVTFVRYSYKGYRDHEGGGSAGRRGPSAHEPDKPTGSTPEYKETLAHRRNVLTAVFPDTRLTADAANRAK